MAHNVARRRPGCHSPACHAPRPARHRLHPAGRWLSTGTPVDIARRSGGYASAGQGTWAERW